MKIPFSTTQFLDVFRSYNEALPWMPMLTYLVGLGALLLIVRRSRTGDRVMQTVLGVFWLWNGAVYHLGFFRTINPAATLFGILFLTQGVMFLFGAAAGKRLQLDFRRTLGGFVGAAMVAYAMVIYPILGHLSGHAYPYAPVFGMAPCPTTIFTFGVLLLARRRVPGFLLAIPFLWSVVGFGAAMSLGIYEDFGLTVAGLLGTTITLINNFSRTGDKMKEKKNETKQIWIDPHGDSAAFLAKHGLG